MPVNEGDDPRDLAALDVAVQDSAQAAKTFLRQPTMMDVFCFAHKMLLHSDSLKHSF
jgi:hypothetical protein